MDVNLLKFNCNFTGDREVLQKIVDWIVSRDLIATDEWWSVSLKHIGNDKYEICWQDIRSNEGYLGLFWLENDEVQRKVKIVSQWFID